MDKLVERRMDKFVERQNIAYYVDLLKTETDPTKRTTVERLLAEERGKQARARKSDHGRPTDIS
jgi:hypothetical protein